MDDRMIKLMQQDFKELDWRKMGFEDPQDQDSGSRKMRLGGLIWIGGSLRLGLWIPKAKGAD